MRATYRSRRSNFPLLKLENGTQLPAAALDFIQCNSLPFATLRREGNCQNLFKSQKLQSAPEPQYLALVSSDLRAKTSVIVAAISVLRCRIPGKKICL